MQSGNNRKDGEKAVQGQNSLERLLLQQVKVRRCKTCLKPTWPHLSAITRAISDMWPVFWVKWSLTENFKKLFTENHREQVQRRYGAARRWCFFLNLPPNPESHERFCFQFFFNHQADVFSSSVSFCYYLQTNRLNVLNL